MAIKLIIDSTSNLEKDYIKKHNIDVVSLSIVFDDVEVKEVDIDNIQSYYEKMAIGEYYLKTSQPGVLEFEEAMRKALDGGKNDVIVVTLGSYLSGTNNCANLAQKSIGSDKIHVIDSGQTIHGMGLFIEEIVDMINAGKTIDEILKEIPGIISRIHIYFVPSTLRFLRKGGRIGTLSAMLGSILQIRPILHFHKNVLSCAKKVLGFGKSLIELAALVPKTIKKFVLMNAAGGENTNILKNAIEKRGYKIDRESNELSLVVIAHIGPGAVGAAFIEA